MPRYQFTLKDPVDPALLQQALDAALEAAPYYRVRLVWEKRKAFLEPNSEPCLVYPDSVMREMPEQTNGYFFALHCAQNTVYFDWFHFIADGHGYRPSSPASWSCTVTCATVPPLQTRPSPAARPTTSQSWWSSTRCRSWTRLRCSGRWWRPARSPCTASESGSPKGSGGQRRAEWRQALLRPHGPAVHRAGRVSGQGHHPVFLFRRHADAMGAPNARYNCVCSFQDR